MASTKIDWADKVWNPVTGCSPISEGCAHCYAQRMAKRLAGRYGYPEDEPFRATFHEDKLIEPFAWKKPKRVFVCSMGDLFHPDVKDEWINAVFASMVHPMSGMSHHTYMILTKRPDRILKGHAERFKEWPNLWLGVTCENQARADERIPILLQIPAAKRFVSIEPMLGEVDLSKWLCQGELCPEIETCLQFDGRNCLSKLLDWVILGGETGPGARPMHPDWVRKVRDDCVSAGVPFFFKQWGKWGINWLMDPQDNYKIIPGSEWMDPSMKKTGHLLDGREWREIPAGAKWRQEGRKEGV